MKCDDFQSRYLAGDVDTLVDAHLAGCAACGSQRSSLDRLRAVMSDPTLWELPSSELEDRIVGELRRLDRPDQAAGSRRWPMVAAAVLVVVALAGAVAWRTAPDWEVDLVAAEVAGGASATVVGWQTEWGTRMRFDIDGLEPAGDNEYYEIWLTAADGTHVSGGTFSSAGVVEASIGVQRRDFPRVWITLEPVDNDLSPSSIVVFDNPGY